jgi:HEAT repeat protein
LFEILLGRLKDENVFVSKAALQCLGSLCNMQSIKMLIDNLSIEELSILKDFIKAESEIQELSVGYIEEIIKNKI